MTFADWLAQSRQYYRSQPMREATIQSARAFGQGVVRRTVDPYLGDVWWERDNWDVLVVMDACRVDLARETLPVDVGSVWSPASTSIDWIERHFAPQYRDVWTDTAYVTANPFADHDTEDVRSADLSDRDLGYFDPVYKRAWRRDQIGTTPPGAVTDAALGALERDIDRLIVHYMQPHQPFRSRPEWESVYSNLENLTTELNHGGPDIWQRCRDGEIDRAELWAAYRDNLHWVWDEVQSRLLPGLPSDATVIVTADHGNGTGEWGVWGHPPGTAVPAVRKVPVVSIDGTGRQTAVEPTSDSAVDDSMDDLTDQLEALGYLRD